MFPVFKGPPGCVFVCVCVCVFVCVAFTLLDDVALLTWILNQILLPEVAC